MSRVRVMQADITQLHCDAIVNAAHATLLGGGGVDGAIYRAAGPELLKECRGLGGCPTGSARITRGYRLLAPYVIHTVGPIWAGGSANEAALLAGCYRACFALAREHDLRSLAFPAISCGVYGYPHAAAASIAVREVSAALAANAQLQDVVLVCFSEAMLAIYQAQLRTSAVAGD